MPVAPTTATGILIYGLVNRQETLKPVAGPSIASAIASASRVESSTRSSNLGPRFDPVQNQGEEFIAARAQPVIGAVEQLQHFGFNRSCIKHLRAFIR